MGQGAGEGVGSYKRRRPRQCRCADRVSKVNVENWGAERWRRWHSAAWPTEARCDGDQTEQRVGVHQIVLIERVGGAVGDPRVAEEDQPIHHNLEEGREADDGQCAQGDAHAVHDGQEEALVVLDHAGRREPDGYERRKRHDEESVREQVAESDVRHLVSDIAVGELLAESIKRREQLLAAPQT